MGCTFVTTRMCCLGDAGLSKAAEAAGRHSIQCPFADEFVWGAALNGLQSMAEIISVDEAWRCRRN